MTRYNKGFTHIVVISPYNKPILYHREKNKSRLPCSYSRTSLNGPPKARQLKVVPLLKIIIQLAIKIINEIE